MEIYKQNNKLDKIQIKKNNIDSVSGNKKVVNKSEEIANVFNPFLELLEIIWQMK